MRKPALLAGLALAAGVLTGCGGGGSDDTAATDTETYCTELEASKEYFQAFSGGTDADASDFGTAIEKFHTLADAAPEDIAPSWDVLDGALSELERALAEAGITTDDLASLQQGEIPKGVDMAKLTKLAPKVQALDSPELKEAGKEIRTHAEDECGVTLDAT